jgi:transposase
MGMKAVANEKRELIIAAKQRGEKIKDIALWLEVSERSVKRIWKLYQETETIQPKKRHGRKPKLEAAEIKRIQEAVKIQPDITLEELIESLGLPIKKSRLSVVLIGLGLRVKKRHYLPKNR